MTTIISEDKKQLRAIKLFEKTPIKKAIFIVTIPGILTMLTMGLYAFFNQVFILNFVPRTIGLLDGDLASNSDKLYFYLNSNLPHLNREQFDLMFSYYTSTLPKGEYISTISSDVMASISINAAAPFFLTANAVIFLIPMGSSVYYTKCITKKVERTGKDLWATTFWTSFAVALFTTFLIYVFIWSNLTGQVISHSKFNAISLKQLDMEFKNKDFLENSNLLPSQIFTSYYDASRKMATSWVNTYLYIYGSGSILQALYLLFSYLLRAEGKNAHVMIWAIVANIIGLAFDALFIIVFKMGILGGALATLIGWVFNLASYSIYILIGNKKNNTWLSYKHLLHFKFRWKLLMPISLLGLSAFVRTLGVGLINLMITLLLNNLPFSDGFTNVYNWAKAAPSITLFALALFGISDGAASLLSYNYTQRNTKRIREIYWWSLLIGAIYALVVYILVASFAKYFALSLYVPEDRLNDVILYMRINMLRMIFYSLAIGGILLFRATNDIKMSILIVSLETFITFWFVMGISVGIGFTLFNNGYPNSQSSLVVSIGFALNALAVGIISFILSLKWLYKTLPNIDKNQKLSWSLKIENNFFEHAYELENAHKKALLENN
ncbi:MATE family efflux transporter [Mycoplasma miroungirhinis]|uniref:Multidrug transporter MATE n=1 Tax=Mycoplasma miroungirhinis TaxID=754516 RepID=A0A6M4JBV9_9MOLU|nr:MATE family efflux transporter [Mycoplasma miroungirhinis]QJR44400.1 multidrug transporter MATE [Mycoplasma miroungirhinis]